MKKFLYKIALFLLFFLILFICIGKFDNVARCQNKNENILKLTCMQNFDSLDILFLGNSYCYSGINTLCFDSAGIKTFNLGVATGGINFYSVLAKDYIKSVSKKPKSIFMLVSPMTLSDKSDDAMNNPIYRYLNYPISVEDYIYSYDRSLIKSYPKILARSFSRTFVNLYGYVIAKKNYCEKENNSMFYTKGFIPSSKVSSEKEELKTNHFFTPFLKLNFDTVKAQKILSVAEEFEKKGIKVVFYELPSNKLYSFFNKTYLKDYINFTKEVENKYMFMDVKVYLDQSKYRDQDHVNTSGSIITSNELIKKIKSNKILEEIYFKK